MPKKINAARQELIDSLLNDLKNNEIPWEKPWDANTLYSFKAPYNYASNHVYQNSNQLFLMLKAIQNNWNDNRWMTFKQANEKGYKIKKGERGSHIEKFRFYDTKTKKDFDWNEYNKLPTKEEKEEKIKDLYVMEKVFTVFNGTQIEGIPPLEQKLVPEIQLKNELDEKVKNIISNMGLKNFKEEGTQAYYSPLMDVVVVPPKTLFKDSTYFNATILHELSHATGHESRLNRDLQNQGGFGTEGYALEELRAEISSLFMQSELGIELKTQHERNNHAYIQNWMQVLENNPEALFSAIKDANKISDFLTEKAESRNLEYEFKQSLAEEPIKEKVEVHNMEVPLSSTFTPHIIKNLEYANMNLANFEPESDVTKIMVSSYAMNNLSQTDFKNKTPSLEYLGPYSFRDNFIADITFNDALKRIDDGGFENNIVSSITFGKSLEYLGQDVFKNNRTLHTIEFTSIKPPIFFNNTFIGTNISKIIVPNETLEKYRTMLKEQPSLLKQFGEQDINKLIQPKIPMIEKTINLEQQKVQSRSHAMSIH